MTILYTIPQGHLIFLEANGVPNLEPGEDLVGGGGGGGSEGLGPPLSGDLKLHKKNRKILRMYTSAHILVPSSLRPGTTLSEILYPALLCKVVGSEVVRVDCIRLWEWV